ncbi:MAG TPA: hypothetical protein VGL27_08505 [Negativicutes bacterium]|jgi:rubrerythrin
MEEKTKIRIIKELDVELLDDSVDEDEKIISLLICECVTCHWRFAGDCNRFGYGYTSEGVQTPYYCPMCGKEIEDVIEDRR